MSEHSVQHDVYSRLLESGALDHDWSALIMYALEGPEALEEALGGGHAVPPDLDPPASPTSPIPCYLRSVTVQGFRGIGDEVTLDIRTGPGLTLVVGRNGSGKSSFAEALEVLLTGNSKRFESRTKDWLEDWRNLHHPHPALIEASLVLEGSGETRVERTWDADAILAESSTTAQVHGKQKGDLSELGWDEPLVTFRPFLSYNELGSLLESGPSKLYTALFLVLGLEELAAAQDALAKARLERSNARKEVRAAAKLHQQKLIDFLGAHDEGRAVKALEIISASTYDLDALDSLLVTADGSSEEPTLDALRKACVVESPAADKVQQISAELREALTNTHQLSGTDAGRAQRRAEILQQALNLHASHGDTDCPVCKTRGVLNPEWKAAAEEETRALREEALEVEQSRRRLSEAERRARMILVPVPSFLRSLTGLGLDPAPAISAWESLAENGALDGEALADHVDQAVPALEAHLKKLRADAAEELQKRDDAWRPLAIELTAWSESARAVSESATHLADIERAESWLKKASEEIRNERFAPIADKAAATWGHLRQNSNVELQKIQLSGARTSRRVALSVTVDGKEGAALGIMSQGELHSLALSLFLPRATLQQSPFHFVVIDDPVQAMDPAKVDGLARALEETAQNRQVIVFTHDERLPDAVRRLQIGADVIEVTRREHSVVELRRTTDPITASIKDAKTLALEERLDDEVKRRTVPGFCRVALEAACAEVLRRRRLARGDSHHEVETALVDAQKLTSKLSLAIFDEPNRGNEVVARLQTLAKGAGKVYTSLNKGAHHGYDGDLLQLVHDTDDLAKKVLAIK